MLGMTSGADWLIAGLGNPEPKYDGTRHNAGFEALDYLAAQWHCDISKAKWQGLYGTAQVGDHKVVLLKPLTYMNLSGESVIEALNFYKIDPETEMLVIFDDISLDPGHIRIRKKGSAGGHNGIKNIIAHAGTQNFMRIKVGVGAKPEGWDLADHVLGRFKEEDRKLVECAIQDAIAAAGMILRGDIDQAMNDFNGKK